MGLGNGQVDQSVNGQTGIIHPTLQEMHHTHQFSLTNTVANLLIKNLLINFHMYVRWILQV